MCAYVCVCVYVLELSMWRYNAYLCNLPQPLCTCLSELLFLFLVINGPATPKTEHNTHVGL